MEEAVQVAIPPPASSGPRSQMSRRIVALEVGESTTFPYLERSTVTGNCHYWGKSLGRTFATRRDRKDRTRLRVWRLT